MAETASNPVCLAFVRIYGIDLHGLRSNSRPAGHTADSRGDTLHRIDPGAARARSGYCTHLPRPACAQRRNDTHMSDITAPDVSSVPPVHSGFYGRLYGRLAPTRRYVCGQTRSRDFAQPLTIEDVERMFAEADRRFAAELGRLGTDAATAVGATPRQVVSALNYMHPVSKRLTLCDDVKLDNVLALLYRLHEERVPGDLIETGVWRGGMTIWMRAALRALGDTTRAVWVADSFAGLPEPDPALELRDAIWSHMLGSVQSLSVGLDDVKRAFAQAGLLDARVRFLPGWFADTLPNAPIERLAMMRLDGDWYESTRDALRALYPRLVPGGYAIIDDYGLTTGCARAVDEYRVQQRIDAPLIVVDRQTVYWRKSR